MKTMVPVLAAALALGACATPRAAAPGIGAAQPPAAERAAEAGTPGEPTGPGTPTHRAEPAAAAPSGAPERWWLLDAETDGVQGAGVERGYAELLAGRAPKRTVVVAIIDSGVDTAHVDLRANLWTNEDETPGNGRDDDGNGYVDDVRGWNFIGGPDGRNVGLDTYEVTRLYAAYRTRFEGALPDTLSGAARREHEHYLEVKAAFEAKRDTTAQMLAQVTEMKGVVDQVVALLRAQVGADSLTRERVATLFSMRNDVRRAREIYLDLADQGITPAMIDAEVERLEELMAHGLNPEFDPRALVGDDYADTSERRYGNADVTGPDAMHGTHVAGIIGAVRGNGVGIDGVAPAVRLMAIRAVPDGDERDKDVANAIRYAVDNGAHIVNMSFGKAWSPNKAAVDAAVRYAEEKGVLLVHAAGNDGVDLESAPNFPHRRYESGGSAANWIEVGASGWQGPDNLAATFSNYGRSRVDVFAPGVDIVSAVPGDHFEASSGTSMAAPVVSGIAALVMAYYPELTAAEVRRIILDSAVRLPGQSVLRPGSADATVPFAELSATGGLVNAHAALRSAAAAAAGR